MKWFMGGAAAGFLIVGCISCKAQRAHWPVIELDPDTCTKKTVRNIPDVTETIHDSDVSEGVSRQEHERSWTLGSELITTRNNHSESANSLRCILGVTSDGQGKIWFVTSEGIEGRPQSPGPDWGEYSQYGADLARTADMDNDGCEDLLVGAPGGKDLPGRIFLISMQSREVLSVIDWPGEGSWFGSSICAVPDIDGDGMDDVAAAVVESAGQGCSVSGSLRVDVVSTATGESLLTVGNLGPSTGRMPRTRLLWLGGDQSRPKGTLIIGLPHPAPGRVVALDLDNGTERWVVKGTLWGECLGWSMDVIGDLDGDTCEDLIIGSPYGGTGPEWSDDWDIGRVLVVSGGDGGILYEVRGPVYGLEFGKAVAACEDIDGDGVSDWLAASRLGLWSGSVFLVSGSSGDPTDLFGFCEPSLPFRLGHKLAAGDDWDGDGVQDFCVSSSVPEAGYSEAQAVALVSMGTGKLIDCFTREDLAKVMSRSRGEKENGR